MSLTNKERIGRALDLVQAGLGPFADREVREAFSANQLSPQVFRKFLDDRNLEGKKISEWDLSPLLKLMWEGWHEVFRKTLGQSDRSLVSELREIRNRWAHQQAFTSDDAYRALDSAQRLLSSVAALPQAGDLEKMKMELLRARFEEQTRGEMRKSPATVIGSEASASASLRPWREVVSPHPDVASGRYQQAEFAADLWQVHLNQGSEEYRQPVEFFRRTYLTESLKNLLKGAVERLTGRGGDPVVQLQTNFGGGKTHSMLALYHLFSGVAPSELVGVEALLAEAGLHEKPPTAKRVVLVGNKISPGNPIAKPDGTQVRTLWGELAWQLGGKSAYQKIENDDRHATNPGDLLRELFNEHAPCLILIDEWVAYARGLHDHNDLPGGSFDTQFSFAQALTESAKLADRTLLLVSLPASDTAGSPHTRGEDVEVGGERGHRALERLRNIVGRIESSWRPATAEEGFEIVRRRLFETLNETTAYTHRDHTCRVFGDYYRNNQSEFPSECALTDYEKRLRAAYPIHPELFDRLYGNWSTLPKFQRTRGVLRLMAAVIHSLWRSDDRNPIILPANIPLDDPAVQAELTRYLPDNWVPIIERDIDGPNSLPQKTDGANNNLGRYQACRRVARSIFLGSAPTSRVENRGLEDRQVKLGCVLPGEAASHFGDAMRRLAQNATYLYHDGARYWYETQPTVTKLAEDKAQAYLRQETEYLKEIESRLRADLKKPSEFSRVHILPGTSADVPDDLDARLVVLSIDHPYSKDPSSKAEVFARELLEQRGNSPRLYRNTLAFLAADETALKDFVPEVCKLIAWQWIVGEKESLNLSPHQYKQALTQRDSVSRTLDHRLPAVYQWLLYPKQENPHTPVHWECHKVSGGEPLAVRAAKKLQSKEDLYTRIGFASLRHELDRVPLWRGNHVGIRQLVDDFARYLYLSRLKDSTVLTAAIRDGFDCLDCLQAFAYAEFFEENSGRYRGLQHSHSIPVAESDPGLLVRPEIALAQAQPVPVPTAATSATATASTPPAPSPKPRPIPKRFQGAVELDPARVGRDAARISEEILTHLTGLPGAEVSVRLEIEVKIPEGAPEQVVRTVTENVRALKFTNGAGFESG